MPPILVVAILVRAKETLFVVLSCVFLVANDVEHLYMCLLPTFFYKYVYIFKCKTSTNMWKRLKHLPR